MESVMEKKCEIVIGNLGTFVPGRIEYSQPLIEDMLEGMDEEAVAKHISESAAAWIKEGVRLEVLKMLAKEREANES